MLTTPFLTDLDSRAAVKGSRDPLGLQLIWARFGRYVVGNLNTVSNSVRDFTVLLLGYHFAEQLSQELGPGTELAIFLKWEQLAAYSRVKVNRDTTFRGTERVQRNLADGSRVTLSDERSHQILGNQKIYGLWGLYTFPARASGLLDGDPCRLTPPATELVDRLYLPMLSKGTGRDARRVQELLKPKSIRMDVDGAEAPVVQAIGKVLQRRLLAQEREFYRSHLLYGGPTDATSGRQQQLAELVDATLDQSDFTWSPARMAELAKTCRARGENWHSLAHHLGRIRTCESVLAPVSRLFSHLLGLDGKPVSAVTARLRETWGASVRTVDPVEFQELRSEMEGGDLASGDRWIEIARTLATGKYAELLHLLVEQNRSVMTGRGGTPWIELPSGKLRIRFRDEHGKLPSRDELPALWRFPYFLDSMRSVALAVRDN